MMLSEKLLSLFFICVCLSCSLQAEDSVLADLEQLSYVKQGLCSIVPCADAALPSALAAKGSFLTHAIVKDRQHAQRLRAEISALPAAGTVCIEALSLHRLPYNQRSIDLFICPGDVSHFTSNITAAELMRVLTPKGQACIKVTDKAALQKWLNASDIKQYTFKQAKSEWLLITKERDQGLDDWGHRTHAADGNPVSRDQVLEAPTLLQWIAGPTRNYGRGDSGVLAHRPNGVVSADGRNYYVHGHNIVARNSFNGVVLWVKNFGTIHMTKIVAHEQSLFLSVNDRLLEIDAMSGETKRTFADALKVGKILVSDGCLFALASNVTKVFDLHTAKEKWTYTGRLGSVCIQDGKLYAEPAAGSLSCLDVNSGKELWTADTSAISNGKANLFFVSNNCLIMVEKQKKATPVTVISAVDGTKLWTMTSDRGGSLIFEAGGLLWVEHVSPDKPKQGVKSLWIGFDLKTGKETLRHIGPANVKYRCHPVYATDKYMIANRPLYFMDWKSGQAKSFEGTRAQCGVAYTLAQGMFYGLYTTPGKCMCISTAIAGITGFSADGTMNGEMDIRKEGQLVKGTAQAPTNIAEEDANDLWPMYRKTPRRSSATAASLSANLSLTWTNTLKGDLDLNSLLMRDWKVSRPSGDRISAAAVGGGKAFVALTHEHQVAAIDIQTGKTTWTVHTPARVTASPTYYMGLCLYACHNGWVYCVRADNGESVWSFRAAPDERRMVAYGQIESSWPIAGGVLLVDDLVYVVAGRLTESDGGLYISALKPQTGELVWSERRGRVDGKPFGAYQPRRMQTYVGAVDMLTSDGKIIGMAGSHRGRMDCKTGTFISHYNHAIPFGWNPTRFRTDQYGVRTVPVAFLKKSYVATDRKTQSIRRYGDNGWRHSVPPASRVEGIVAVSDNVQEVKPSAWRPSARVPLVATAPKIDGEIDEAFEKHGTAVEYVFLNGRKNKQRELTTAWMLCDKEHIYFAFRCYKKNPQHIQTAKTQRDDAVWQDEVVEIFLDPKNSRTKNYYHFIINSAAVIQDLWKGDKKWNAEGMVAKAGKETDAWTVELSIPLKSLGVDLSANKVWSANFNRSARKVNGSKIDEDTAWAPTNTDSSHVPDMFGYLWLDAAAGAKDDRAFNAWQDALPKKPVHKKQDSGSFQNFLLAALAVDKNDMHKGGELRVLSLEDGKLIKTYPLPVAPAHDGMVVVNGKVFVSLRDTSLLCFRGE